MIQPAEPPYKGICYEPIINPRRTRDDITRMYFDNLEETEREPFIRAILQSRATSKWPWSLKKQSREYWRRQLTQDQTSNSGGTGNLKNRSASRQGENTKTYSLIPHRVCTPYLKHRKYVCMTGSGCAVMCNFINKPLKEHKSDTKHAAKERRTPINGIRSSMQ